jgi:hypothetical protein
MAPILWRTVAQDNAPDGQYSQHIQAVRDNFIVSYRNRPALQRPLPIHFRAAASLVCRPALSAPDDE